MLSPLSGGGCSSERGRGSSVMGLENGKGESPGHGGELAVPLGKPWSCKSAAAGHRGRRGG